MRQSYQLLGPLQIDNDGDSCDVTKSPKGCALVAYLIVTRRVHSREAVADLLWEARTTTQSLNNLRQLLSRVRRWVPELQITRQRISFQAGEEVFIDLYDFQSALGSGDLSQIETAVKLYRGDLLADFYLDDTPRFNEWLVLEREHLRQQALMAYHQLSTAYEQQEKWAEGIELTRRWLELDEFDEAVHRQLMSFLAREGRIVAALQHFEDCKERLMNAWGVELEQETLELAHQLESYLAEAGLSILDETPLGFQVAQPRPGELPAPQGLPPNSMLSFHRNQVFTGRRTELLQLGGVLFPVENAPNGLVRAAAITGMAGLGKTQLTVEYAYRYGRFYPGGVYWLSFAQPDQITKEVANLGGEGGLGLYTDADKLTLPEKVERVRRAWQSTIPRLLIFDNCEEIALAADWLPVTGGCHVLLTSRISAWPATLPVTEIPLGVLPRNESVRLLQRLATQLDDEAARAISAALGDLPLALQLVGSYLSRHRHIRPDEYLAQLQDQNLLDHISLGGKHARYSPTGHESNVARAFGLSYARLASDTPENALARQLLSHVTCFAPGELIPVDFLLDTIVENEENRLAHLLAESALELLVSLGLLMRPNADNIVIHRLLAAFVSAQWDDKQEASLQVENALSQTLLNYWERERHLETLPLSAGHVAYITDQALTRSDLSAATLSFWWGLHLLEIQNLPAAQNFLQSALTIRKNFLGPDHPETAKALNYLGTVSWQSGEMEVAQSYYERALAIFESQLGTESFEAAKLSQNLGVLYSRKGVFVQAKQRYEDALAIYRRILAPDNAEIGVTLYNLGILSSLMGDFAAARSNYEQAYAIFNSGLGIDNPLTINTINNFGTLELNLGNYTAAQQYLEQGFIARLNACGEKHPATALTLNNLGVLSDRMGDYASAKRYLERAFAIREELFGPGHLKTARSLSNLGNTLLHLGEIGTAQAHLERALKIQKETQPQHTETADTLNHLGDLYRTRGDFALAHEMLQQALSLRKSASGETHPDTAHILISLGELYLAEGRNNIAHGFFHRAHSILEAQVSPTHYDLKRVLNLLGEEAQNTNGEIAHQL